LTLSEPTTPPDLDELEISLFGPGFGECVVAHLGWGDWLVVDSCVGPDGQTPAGLDYLKRLGVDVAQSVKRVVATHWHNDHVRGLAQIVKECEEAKFICPQAMFSKEFVSFTDLWKRQNLATSLVTELTDVIETISQSPSSLKGGGGDSRLGFAIQNRCVWRRSAAGSVASAELHSLSPSDAAVTHSLNEIASLCFTGNNLTKPIPSHPNQFSIVLWLQIGEERLLLGADMEEKNNPYGGWSLIVKSAERPSGQASLFKVPHHGSDTGECAAVWDQMLFNQPLALVTPFRNGRVTLPKPEDTQRISGRTRNSYITAGFDDRSSRGKTGTVNRTIQETVRYIKKVNGAFGHVRARKKIQPSPGSWVVETFGNAMSLADLRSH